jgi:hypothetical protein
MSFAGNAACSAPLATKDTARRHKPQRHHPVPADLGFVVALDFRAFWTGCPSKHPAFSQVILQPHAGILLTSLCAGN